jgi:phosphoserine phosphatase
MSAPTAAFFRVEGVLVRRSARACAAWMAARQQQVGHRLLALGAVALSAPLGAPGGDPLLATKLSWRALEGCSEDRLIVLAEDWWALQLRPHLHPPGLELLTRCREQGMQIVLLSDHPEPAIAPLRDLVRADALICNHLAMERGRLTGALIPPIFTGQVDGTWLRAEARRLGVDPEQSLAYGASASDATLLSAVGRPCTVTPDRALRRLAATFDWPVVEAR